MQAMEKYQRGSRVRKKNVYSRSGKVHSIPIHLKKYLRGVACEEHCRLWTDLLAALYSASVVNIVPVEYCVIPAEVLSSDYTHK